MARVGVTTTAPPPSSLASSSSSSAFAAASPSASGPARKRIKVHNNGCGREGGGGHERQQELARLGISTAGSELGDGATNEADLDPGRRSCDTAERCSSSPSAVAATAVEEVNGLDSDASCCSSNGSSVGALEFVDLQEDDERVEVEISSMDNYNGRGERRETIRSAAMKVGEEDQISDGQNSVEEKKPCEEEDQLNNSTVQNESAAENNSPRRNYSTMQQQPEAAQPAARQRIVVTDAEVELFFSMNAQEELNRLKEKYNFDFGNEKPLEGRYEWIPLKR